MHPARLVTLGAAGFAALALALPFATFPAAGRLDGIGADAWPAVVALVPVAIVMLSGRRGTPLGAGPGLFGAGFAAAALVYAALKLADAIIAVRDAPGASLGPGGWVLIAAATVALGSTVVGVLVNR